jgi:hypothetical protein
MCHGILHAYIRLTDITRTTHCQKIEQNIFCIINGIEGEIKYDPPKTNRSLLLYLYFEVLNFSSREIG